MLICMHVFLLADDENSVLVFVACMLSNLLAYNARFCVCSAPDSCSAMYHVSEMFSFEYINLK